MNMIRKPGIGAYARCVSPAPPKPKPASEDGWRKLMEADAKKMKPSQRQCPHRPTPISKIDSSPKTLADAKRFIRSKGGPLNKPSIRQAEALGYMLTLGHATAAHVGKAMRYAPAETEKVLCALERRAFIRLTDDPGEDERYPVYALDLVEGPE